MVKSKAPNKIYALATDLLKKRPFFGDEVVAVWDIYCFICRHASTRIVIQPYPPGCVLGMALETMEYVWTS